MNSKLCSLIVAVAGCLFLMLTPSSHAQGTVFTYQGRLSNGTNYANGSFDLAFTLYATNTTGTAIAGPVTNTAVGVSNGLFTTLVNFTNGFAGGSNWLQIAVSTNGANSFSPLLPRQQVTPVPYAVQAENISGTLTSPGLGGTYGNYLNLTNTYNNISGIFSGNGTGLFSVNASTLGGLSSAGFWRTNGNTGANSTNGAFLGNVDNLPLEVRVNNLRALRLESVNHNGYAHPTVNVVGGYSGNSAGNGDGVTIAGGGGSDGSGITPNTVTIDFAFIGGGYGNTVGSEIGTVAGGYGNSVVGSGPTGAGFVGGGSDNTASGDTAAISGGFGNKASGADATIGGGSENSAGGVGAFVGGGGVDGVHYVGNTANGNASVIGGGLSNSASGNYATIAGGSSNSAAGTFSFAGGQQAQALNQGAFVWADSQNAAFSSTANDQFLIRAQGGVGIGTGSPAKQLDVTSSAAGVPVNSSVDPSVFVRVNNSAMDGSIANSDVAGIGFGNNSTRQAIVGATYGYDFLDFYLAGNMTTPRVRMLGNGNIGIGTTAPSALLEVNGNAKVDGTLTATNFSGNGSAITGVPVVNLKQIALLKWEPNLVDNTFGCGFQPQALCFDGANIWEANYGAGTVMSINANTGFTNGTYTVGSQPDAICFDGTSIWVANYGSGNIMKLNAATGVATATAITGVDPTAICFDGSNIWVGLSSIGVVITYNASNGIVDTSNGYSDGNTNSSGVRTGSVGGLCCDGANIWVTDSASNNVAKLNKNTGALSGPYPVGTNPQAVCFDGANIWVANFSSANVTKLNASTGAIIGTYPAGSTPNGICFDGANIWVCNYGPCTMTKLSGTTGAIIGTYSDPVGLPQGVCFDGAFVWTANTHTSTLSKF